MSTMATIILLSITQFISVLFLFSYNKKKVFEVAKILNEMAEKIKELDVEVFLKNAVDSVSPQLLTEASEAEKHVAFVVGATWNNSVYGDVKIMEITDGEFEYSGKVIFECVNGDLTTVNKGSFIRSSSPYAKNYSKKTNCGTVASLSLVNKYKLMAEEEVKATEGKLNKLQQKN